MSDQRVPMVPLPRMADQKHCFSCGRVLHVTATACPYCGAAQPAAGLPSAPPHVTGPMTAHTAFCRGCGAPIHDEALACPRCGAPQRTATAMPGSDKSRLVAALLAFLLGGIGAHKFYLGSIGWGIVYLLFCWTFIPSIAALIEGFIYLTQSDEEFARAYR